MPRSLGSTLARHGWLIAIAVTYLYVFPYFPRIHSANELPRVYLVKAIADDHAFSIDNGVRRWTKAEGGGPTADITRVGGHDYSNKAPGSSMLAALPYAVVEVVAGEPDLPFTLWLCRVFAGIVPMLLFLPLLYRFLERYAPEPAIRQLVCLAYALGSAAMTYSMLYFSHQLAAICVASAWIIGLEAAERQRGLRWFGIAGALAGASALVDYQAIFAAIPAAVHIVTRMTGWSRRDLAIAIGIATACALVPIAILLGYHAICFGSPWATGYGAIAGDKVAGTDIAFASNHAEGFLGLTKLRREALVGATVALDTGLFSLSPWLLAALPGFVVLARGDRRLERSRRALVELVIGGALIAIGIAIYLSNAIDMTGRVLHPVIDLPIIAGIGIIGLGASRVFRGEHRGSAAVGASVLVFYLLFLGALTFWRGGWGIGPRYIVALLPFVLPAVAAALSALHRRDRRILGAALGTVLAGIAIYTLATMTFPYWPESSRHPLYEVTMRLLGDNLVAPNVGSAVGVSGVLGLAPVMLAIAVAVAWAILQVAGRTGFALAVVVMIAIVGGYALAPRGANADRVYDTISNAVDFERGDLAVVCGAAGHARDVAGVVGYIRHEGIFSRRVGELVELLDKRAITGPDFAAAIRERFAPVRCPTLELLERGRP